MRTEYLTQLLSITKEQNKALLNDDYEKFIVLLQERQVLIDQVNTEIPFQIVPLSESERMIVKEIESLDKQNQKEYRQQLELTKLELKRINEAKRQNDQYIDPYSAIGSGFSFDHK